MAMLRELRCVDDVFVEESLEKPSATMCREHRAHLLVMGDDWLGKFDESLRGVCNVHCVPRTPSISTTEIIEVIREADNNNNTSVNWCFQCTSGCGALRRERISVNWSTGGSVDGFFARCCA
jgi:hypothetical protein